jgi:hypothetical protein
VAGPAQKLYALVIVLTICIISAAGRIVGATIDTLSFDTVSFDRCIVRVTRSRFQYYVFRIGFSDTLNADQPFIFLAQLDQPHTLSITT